MGTDEAAGTEAAAAGTDESAPAETDEGAGDPAPAEGDGATGGRDVVVPLRLYKTVTVFSTLFAVVFVLAGFVLVDVATDQATASASEVDPVLAVSGLAAILAGAAIYAYSTRFRAAGMGKSKDQSDEGSEHD